MDARQPVDTMHTVDTDRLLSCSSSNSSLSSVSCLSPSNHGIAAPNEKPAANPHPPTTRTPPPKIVEHTTSPKLISTDSLFTFLTNPLNHPNQNQHAPNPALLFDFSDPGKYACFDTTQKFMTSPLVLNPMPDETYSMHAPDINPFQIGHTPTKPMFPHVLAGDLTNLMFNPPPQPYKAQQRAANRDDTDDDDDDEASTSRHKRSKKKKKKKNMFSVTHRDFLMNFFHSVTMTPTRDQRIDLTTIVGTNEKTIRIWFQNQRQKLVRMSRQGGGYTDPMMMQAFTAKQGADSLFMHPNTSFSIRRDNAPPQSIDIQNHNRVFPGLITPITPNYLLTHYTNPATTPITSQFGSLAKPVTTPITSHFVTTPNTSQFAITPNTSQFATTPNTSQFATTPITSQFATTPNTSQFATTHSQFATTPPNHFVTPENQFNKPGDNTVLVNGIYPSPESRPVQLNLGSAANSSQRSMVTPNMKSLSLGGGSTPNRPPTQHVATRTHPQAPFLNVYGDQLSNLQPYTNEPNFLMNSFGPFSLSDASSLSYPTSPLNGSQFPFNPFADLNGAHDSSSAGLN